MKFPKFRRRDYEEDNYANYDDYGNGYDDNADDLNDEIVEDSYTDGADDGMGGPAFEMKIITPKSYDDREEIARCLVMGNAVFLNIEKLDRENIIRLMDYLGGVIYVIEGKVKWSNSSSVIFAPKNVNISGIGDDAKEVDEESQELIDDYN
jgi:FtsZ-interacting cell division protein YlmF